jgi:hypothetical protein
VFPVREGRNCALFQAVELRELPTVRLVITVALRWVTCGGADRHGGPVIVEQKVSPPVWSASMTQS